MVNSHGDVHHPPPAFWHAQAFPHLWVFIIPVLTPFCACPELHSGSLPTPAQADAPLKPSLAL